MSDEYIKKVEAANEAIVKENLRLADENDKLREELKRVEDQKMQQAGLSGAPGPLGVSSRGLGPGVSGVRNGKVYV